LQSADIGEVGAAVDAAVGDLMVIDRPVEIPVAADPVVRRTVRIAVTGSTASPRRAE